MALVLNATPLDEDNNTYLLLADADAYVADKVAVDTLSTAWDALSNDDKALYLIRATEFLDGLVSWFGDRYSADQPLKWPRINVTIEGLYRDYGLTTFPVKVTYATVEMALFLMEQSNATSEANDNALYDAVEVGPLKIDFNAEANGATTKYFPDIIPILLKDLGVIENPDLPNQNRLKQVKLVRA